MMFWASVTAAVTVVSASSWVLRLVNPLISLATSADKLAWSSLLSLVVLLTLAAKVFNVANRRLISLLPRVMMRCSRAWLVDDVLVLARALAGITAKLTAVRQVPRTRPRFRKLIFLI